MYKEKAVFALVELNNAKKLELLESKNDLKDIILKNIPKELIPKEDKIEDFQKYLNEKQINFTVFGEDNYPDKLKDIPYPPAVLYYKGDLTLTQSQCCAIVGSRKCSYYGSAVTKSISNHISKMDITIVSGAAKGIDAIAHKAAIGNKKKTIAVLGCGIDIYYPMENKGLINKIAEDGLLISEFPIGYPPLPKNFPQRNRIISALSRIIIVTEATSKSGSLYTADFALELNKDVMAVPGNISEDNYKGCNNLIREGALVYTSNEDLNVYFGKDVKEDESLLSDDEKKLLKIINFTPKHLENIKESSKIDYEKLNILLLNLQFKNKITCIIGNYYVKCVNE